MLGIFAKRSTVWFHLGSRRSPLSQFESAGIVTRHNFEEGHSVFEMTTEEHHDHMVCVNSGKTIEFQDPVIEQRLKEIADLHGYQIVDRSIVLYAKEKET